MDTSRASSRERWERIERAFQATLDLPPQARAAHLETACGQDPGLRREVEALLTGHEAAGDFLEAPLDTQRAAGLIEATSEDPTDPHEVGPYRIVRRLGQGGMGVVYLAHDSRLNRQVALKFLSPHLGMDRAAKRRFVEEAKAASALDDPLIATIYEIGETAEGELYIAMAYCAGETLRDKLEHGALPVGEAVEIAAQISEGLAAAHANGVVHRDVKPGNVIVSAAGRVKIVDFGIARAAGCALTGTGVRLGTPAYMSPEQTRGQTVDHRTDLWSLGVVLYEMLAGVRPFSADSDEAVLYGIRHDPPRSLDETCPGLPQHVLRVVERCLQKDPADRYPDASALRADLLAAAGRIGPSVADAPTSPRRLAAFHQRLAALKPIARRRPALLAALALILLLGLTSIFYVSHDGDGGSRPAQALATGAAPSIAILPFSVRGPEVEVWREGMVDLVSTNLDGVAGIRAIDSRTVMARWREAVDESQTADLTRALQVARRTGARYAVTGSAVASRRGLRLVAAIYDTETGEDVGQAQVEGASDSVFALVDRLSIEVLRAILGSQAGSLPKVDLARVTTASLPALKAYLEGELLYRRSDFTGAIPAYLRAVEADSSFALALYRLSNCYAWGENTDVVLFRQYAEQAARNVGRLTEREALFVRVWSGRLKGREALDALRRGVRNYPDDSEVWFLLGETYYHNGPMLLTRPEEAERAFERAIQVDSTFTPAYIHLVHLAFVLEADSARAARLAETYERLAPRSEFVPANRLALDLTFGHARSRERARASLDTTSTGTLRNLSSLGYFRSPRLLHIEENLLEVLRPRPDFPNRAFFMLSLLGTYVDRGKLRAGLALLNDPAFSESMLPYGSYLLHNYGVDVPVDRMERALELAVRDSAPEWGPLGAAALAADLGRWKEHETIVARFRAYALAASDSAAARDAAAAAEALEAYRLWRQGRPGQALAVFQRQQATGVFFDEDLRWWIARILLELDRPREAERYWLSLGSSPWAQLQLARIYEELGEHEKARRAWELVATGWHDADPELQPKVEEARVSVRRLTRAVPK
jgi:serine/threonine-protein kinase